MNKTVIIIPARYGSSRYKGKPLVKILGRELVLRVADVCSKAVGKGNLYVATDHKLIEKIVKKANEILNSSASLKLKNPYGDGKASERIVKFLSDFKNFI